MTPTPSRILRLFTTSALLTTGLGALGTACLSRPIDPLEARTTFTTQSMLPRSNIDKIDILFVIDDSGSMGDKQSVLAQAVPDLITTLANPPCTATDGSYVSSPADPLSDCPKGSHRDFKAIHDIHLAVISTDLGARGGTGSCDKDGLGAGAKPLVATPDDGTLPSVDGKGFLAWDPAGAAPGDGRYDDIQALAKDLEKIVRGVGQAGCGLEAPLESWYRFLVDPKPFTTVSIDKDNYRASVAGDDTELKAQREAFLRPDSLVAIVMLTDENDCSFQSTGFGHITNTPHGPGEFLRARSECAVDVNDPCCAPCSQTMANCQADPQCQSPESPFHQKSNLGCFDQKRRFGMDLLYPVSRYVDALTKEEVPSSDGTTGVNRLLVSKDGLHRGLDRIFLTGIVGVPWQLIARDPSDLGQGFQSAEEMAATGTWDAILGDFENGGQAGDPHMIESIEPRPGLAGPSTNAGSDPIVGHDYTVKASGMGLLQHACTFPLPGGPIPSDVTGDCDDHNSANNPLCQDPATGQYGGGLQYAAKAYPGLRQLAVLKGVKEQAIVGSVCPAQLDRVQDADYGYRPAMNALIARLKEKLGDLCMSRPLQVEQAGSVNCVVLEGRKSPGGQSCEDPIDLEGRSGVTPEFFDAEKVARQSPSGQDLDCFYVVNQLEKAELLACQQDSSDQPTLADGTPLHGWCYVDPAQSPDAATSLVEQCAPTRQQVLRFVGDPKDGDEGLMFISCYQER